jgi:hypothetical protein
VESFASEAAAYRWIDDAQQEAGGRTVRGAVDSYLQAMVDRGLKAASIERSENHLKQLLQLERHGKRPLSWLSKGERGELLYEDAQKRPDLDGKRYANDTHRENVQTGTNWVAYYADASTKARHPGVPALRTRRVHRPQRNRSPRLLLEHQLPLVIGLRLALLRASPLLEFLREPDLVEPLADVVIESPARLEFLNERDHLL